MTTCGVQYPYYVMQFDHLGQKTLKLSGDQCWNYGRTRLIAEIAKCEVVCANCHFERTQQRHIARKKAR